jgi:hypothetical protein
MSVFPFSCGLDMPSFQYQFFHFAFNLIKQICCQLDISYVLEDLSIALMCRLTASLKSCCIICADKNALREDYSKQTYPFAFAIAEIYIYNH